MKLKKAKLEWRNPEDLTPYAKNATEHPIEQIDRLAGQIDKFGFDVPIVVTKDNIIIKGHARREASLRLNLKQVPVIVSTLDEFESIASRIGDNKTKSNAYDLDKMSFDLGTLDRNGFDLSLTGMTKEERDMLSEKWDSDIASLEKLDGNTDGIITTIKVECPQEARGRLKELLEETINNSGFENVEIK